MHEGEIRKQLTLAGFTKIWSYSYLSTVYSKKFQNIYWLNSIEDILTSKKEVLESFKLFDDAKSKKTFLHLIKFRLSLNKAALTPIIFSSEMEYFHKGIISLVENEIFVDGGAFKGEIINRFIELSKNGYKSVYAFEPDSSSFKVLKNRIKRDNIRIYKVGLGERKLNVQFTNDGTSGSRITKYGRKTISINDLDSLLNNRPVTTIKLDIEGAELAALKGAKKIIRKYSPKLAVCVYHRTSDLWSIPLFIKKLDPEYKLFLRHYGSNLYDTICYAVKTKYG